MADYFNKIRPVLEALQIGEAVIYPISRMKSVRTQASELGAIHNRQYTTKTDRVIKSVRYWKLSKLERLLSIPFHG